MFAFIYERIGCFTKYLPNLRILIYESLDLKMLYYHRTLINHYTAWKISQVNIVDSLNIHPFHLNRKTFSCSGYLNWTVFHSQQKLAY